MASEGNDVSERYEVNESTPILLHDQSNKTNLQTDNNNAPTNQVDKDKIIQDLKEEIARLNKVVECNVCLSKSMDVMYSEGPITVAIRRAPALFTTLVLELLGGFVITQLNSVIKKYTLIVSFMPAISALSGNYILLL